MNGKHVTERIRGWVVVYRVENAKGHLIDYGNWEVYARGERAAVRAASKDMGIPQRRIVGAVRAR
jgi:hypothetical protein